MPYEFIGLNMRSFFYRKADLRELKLLQKIENRQYQDLVFKAQYMRDQQEKKFEQEMQVYIEWGGARGREGGGKEGLYAFRCWVCAGHSKNPTFFKDAKGQKVLN